jgi:hypothetical protein
MKMKSGHFKTTNMYVASIIAVKHELEPAYHLNGSIVEFAFPASDKLYQTLTDFHSGGMVEAYRYAETIKRLRADMYKKKKGEETRNEILQQVPQTF